MSKITDLFKMHNIKYICSVDDCYAAPDTKQIRATVYSEIMNCNSKFQQFFFSGDHKESYETILSMASLGAPIDELTRNLVDSLPEHTLNECFKLVDVETQSLSGEKVCMTRFFNSLKEENVIADFKLISNISEASALDLSTFADGAILWLVDKDFSKVEESENAGLEFAKTLVERDQTLNYIYIVSAIDTQSGETEDEVEKEFDSILNTTCDLGGKNSFCYFIYKGKIQTYDTDKIAKSLAQGFRRKANFIIINDIRNYMKQGLDNACEKYKGIDQRTLNYAISEKVIENGESCFEFVIRMMRLLYEEEFRKCISINFESLASKMSQYEYIYDNDLKIGTDERVATSILTSMRTTELYDGEVSKQHKEIGFGDIFSVNGEKYLLVSQPCDVTIRKEGKRRLTHGILLKIEENLQGLGSYSLPCCEGFSKPCVNLHSHISIPFSLLDLCSLTKDGQAIFKSEYLTDEPINLPEYLPKNYKVRFSFIKTELKPILEKKQIIEALNGKSSAEDVHKAYKSYLKYDKCYTDCEIDGNCFVYPIKRVCRIDELHALSIAQQFTSVFARIGLPFDFIKAK